MVDWVAQMTQAAKGPLVAEAHYRWVQKHLNDMPFDPGMQTDKPDDDYNLHNLTVSGSAEQQQELTDAINETLELEMDEVQEETNPPFDPADEYSVMSEWFASATFVGVPEGGVLPGESIPELDDDEED
jgi:hypothetical protein